jgi:hypothetical protein
LDWPLYLCLLGCCRPRNKLQNVAMVSDLFAGLVLALCCLAL